jgi:hypothetical protein
VSQLSPLRPVLGNGDPLIRILRNALTFERVLQHSNCNSPEASAVIFHVLKLWCFGVDRLDGLLQTNNPMVSGPTPLLDTKLLSCSQIRITQGCRVSRTRVPAAGRIRRRSP